MAKLVDVCRRTGSIVAFVGGLLVMAGLISSLTIVRLSMVIRGMPAIVKLASGKAPPTGSREKKMAVVVVLGALTLVAIEIAVIFALDR